MGTTPREPETEAGKRLVEWSEADMVGLDEYGFETVRDAIRAIEAQAAAAERQRLADEVEAAFAAESFVDEEGVRSKPLFGAASVLRLLRGDSGGAA